MTKTARQVALGVAVMGLLAAHRPAMAAEAEDPAISKIRSDSPAIVGLINRATEQSQTFRRLVWTINKEDGIVYVEEGMCGRGLRACLAAVTLVGSTRILLVKVNTHGTDADLMRSIGHELRHTIEVLETPWVTNSHAMYFFYRQLGSCGTTSAFETCAAIDAGNAVRSEVAKHRARTKAR